MARRKTKSFRRIIAPDPVYRDINAARFINVMMKHGKKGIAEKIFYKAIEAIEGKTEEKSGFDVFKKALENVQPVVEVRSRRVGGVTYQVPTSVRPERRLALGIRWMVEAAQNRSEHGMLKKLSAEILDAYKGTGIAMKKKEDTRKMADANKAFAHYRW